MLILSCRINSSRSESIILSRGRTTELPHTVATIESIATPRSILLQFFILSTPQTPVITTQSNLPLIDSLITRLFNSLLLSRHNGRSEYLSRDPEFLETFYDEPHSSIQPRSRDPRAAAHEQADDEVAHGRIHSYGARVARENELAMAAAEKRPSTQSDAAFLEENFHQMLKQLPKTEAAKLKEDLSLMDANAFNQFLHFIIKQLITSPLEALFPSFISDAVGREKERETLQNLRKFYHSLSPEKKKAFLEELSSSKTKTTDPELLPKCREAKALPSLLSQGNDLLTAAMKKFAEKVFA